MGISSIIKLFNVSSYDSVVSNKVSVLLQWKLLTIEPETQNHDRSWLSLTVSPTRSIRCCTETDHQQTRGKHFKYQIFIYTYQSESKNEERQTISILGKVTYRANGTLIGWVQGSCGSQPVQPLWKTTQYFLLNFKI